MQEINFNGIRTWIEDSSDFNVRADLSNTGIGIYTEHGTIDLVKSVSSGTTCVDIRINELFMTDVVVFVTNGNDITVEYKDVQTAYFSTKSAICEIIVDDDFTIKFNFDTTRAHVFFQDKCLCAVTIS